MASYIGSVDTSWSIDKTFAYMADFSNTSSWDPQIKESRHINEGNPVRQGAWFHVKQGRVELDYEPIDLQDNRSVTFRAETKSLVSIDTVTVTPNPFDGTKVTYRVEIELKGVRRFADPLFNLILQRIGNKAREGLQDTIA